MEEIECRASALLDLQSQAGVERFFTGAPDPEIAFAGFAHLDHPLFHEAGPHHDAINLKALVRGERFPAAVDLRPS
jgi:hypothetical protein